MSVRFFLSLLSSCGVSVRHGLASAKAGQDVVHVLDLAELIYSAVYGCPQKAFSTGQLNAEDLDEAVTVALSVSQQDRFVDSDDFLRFLTSLTVASVASLSKIIAIMVRRRHEAVGELAGPNHDLTTVVVLGDLVMRSRDEGKNKKKRPAHGGLLRAITTARNAWETAPAGRRIDWNAIAHFMLGADGLFLAIAESLAVELGCIDPKGHDAELGVILHLRKNGIATVWAKMGTDRPHLEGDTGVARILVMANEMGVVVING
jgi:hypothetical protein